MMIGKMIASYRHANGISVRDLAKIIGVSSATLNRIERCRPCSSNSLAKILLWSIQS